MENKRITTALMCILAVSCIIMTVILISVNRDINRLPEKSVEDIVKILSESGIDIAPDLIPVKRTREMIYLCDLQNYGISVAPLLGAAEVKTSYVIPDGEMIVLSDGALLEFGKDFYFKYFKSGEEDTLPETAGTVSSLSKRKTEELASIAGAFLARGSRGFVGNAQINSEAIVKNIWDYGGKYYVLCTRRIDGVEITGNTVLCTIEGEEVVAARGAWCFLTEGESYSVQLTDMLNILFNVKREIGSSEEERVLVARSVWRFLTEGESYSAQLTDMLNILFNVRREIGWSDGNRVSITAIEQCYSLYFYGENDAFCLIPCWKIITDSRGKFIYNAIDSTLYTNN